MATVEKIKEFEELCLEVIDRGSAVACFVDEGRAKSMRSFVTYASNFLQDRSLKPQYQIVVDQVIKNGSIILQSALNHINKMETWVTKNMFDKITAEQLKRL